MGKKAQREQIMTRTWMVERTGWVDEVEMEVGEPGNRHNVIRYNALVADGGRRPFISRWFNDPVPASDFVESIMTGYDPREERKNG